MKTTITRFIVSALALVMFTANAAEPSAQAICRDSAQPTAMRVEDLLERMTLEEKVGQMNMPCGWVGKLGKTISEKTETVLKATAGTQVPGLGPCGGFFTIPNWILQESPRQQAEFLNRLQKIAIEQTRLGIPRCGALGVMATYHPKTSG